MSYSTGTELDKVGRFAASDGRFAPVFKILLSSNGRFTPVFKFVELRRALRARFSNFVGLFGRFAASYGRFAPVFQILLGLFGRFAASYGRFAPVFQILLGLFGRFAASYGRFAPVFILLSDDGRFAPRRGRFAASDGRFAPVFKILLSSNGRFTPVFKFVELRRALRARFSNFVGLFGRFAASYGRFAPVFQILLGLFGRFAASYGRFAPVFQILLGLFGRFAASYGRFAPVFILLSDDGRFAPRRAFLQSQNDQKKILEKVNEMEKQRKKKVFLKFQENCWDGFSCDKDIEISGDKSLIVHHKGPTAWRSVFAKYPIVLNKHLSDFFYYEISVMKKKKNWGIIFGFAVKQQNKLKGTIRNEKGTYSYDSVGDICINGQGKGRNAKYSYGVGDTVGIGVHSATRQMIFTKNGLRLDTSDFLVDSSFADGSFYPFVSLFNSGDKIEASFGPNFKFDLETL
ncbi:hypothetical protein niasHT_002479 [Heterodera trifolii]|uniref:B30.2/SPRY domain-containing protein n=1 Tax=Heterodera trifolii TaxID=157864 RepID=A0ABD2LMQ9_9BILA